MNNPMDRGAVSRRTVLAGMAAAAAAGTLPGRSLAQDAPTLQWWDHFQPIAPLFEAEWKTDTAVTVKHQVMNPSDMMQSLQLAFRSQQMPDVFSVPAPLAVVDQVAGAGWFAPPEGGFTLDKPFQKEALFEGLTNFGGKVYSFPLFTFRWHSTSLWYDKAKVEKAGIDPAKGPQGWDDIRKVAKSATTGGAYGLLLPLQFTDRMQAHLNDLAQMAGAAGPIDWKTGKYDYASEHYVETLKMLLSLQKDGTLHPASSSMDARQGRIRWAAGEAAMFFDGPWNSGVMAGGMKDALAKTWVTPTPITSDNGHVHAGPLPGTFWISAQSKLNKQATELLNLFTTDEFYIKLAERMDQPPLSLDAVAQANVDPTYKAVIASYKDSVRLAPEPVIRNPDIGKVYAEMRTIDPSLGAIIQGAFSGAFDDPGPVLQQYSDQMSAERDRAIGVINSKGGKVSVDDWVFDNWSPDKDFTPDLYKR